MTDGSGDLEFGEVLGLLLSHRRSQLEGTNVYKGTNVYEGTNVYVGKH